VIIPDLIVLTIRLEEVLSKTKNNEEIYLISFSINVLVKFKDAAADAKKNN